MTTQFWSCVFTSLRAMAVHHSCLLFLLFILALRFPKFFFGGEGLFTLSSTFASLYFYQLVKMQVLACCYCVWLSRAIVACDACLSSMSFLLAVIWPVEFAFYLSFSFACCTMLRLIHVCRCVIWNLSREGKRVSVPLYKDNGPAAIIV